MAVGSNIVAPRVPPQRAAKQDSTLRREGNYRKGAASAGACACGSTAYAR
jgi:hypothetical protein